MARRIVLFGATGYTGRLVAEALVRRRARPVLAGRSHQSLAALGVKLGKGLDTVVADVRRPEALLQLVEPDDVLVSTVGPFSRFGRPVVEAAIYRRATYVDTTGEPPFLRVVFEELSPIALEARVALVPAFAFEFVAGHVAAALCLQEVGDAATRVDIGYFVRGGYRRLISSGTRASAAGAALVPHFAWRDGSLQVTRAGDRTRAFAAVDSTRHAVAVGGEEHITLPRFAPWLRDVGVFQGGTRRAGGARVAGALVAAGSTVPGAARAAGWLGRLPLGREGPAPEQRRRFRSEVVAIASDADGRELRAVRLAGADPYTFSAEILAWAAIELTQRRLDESGALGPLQVFDLAVLRDACAEAGLSVVEG